MVRFTRHRCAYPLDDWVGTLPTAEPWGNQAAPHAGREVGKDVELGRGPRVEERGDPCERYGWYRLRGDCKMADRTPQRRRGFSAARSAGCRTPPGSRYTAGAGGGLRVVASLRLFRRDTGGGCAAAVLHQWKRLRRSEYLGGPNGRFQHGRPRWRKRWTLDQNSRRVLGDAAARRRAWSPGRQRPWGGAALSAGFTAERRSSH